MIYLQNTAMALLEDWKWLNNAKTEKKHNKGWLKKQRNTSHHRGAYMNTTKSGGGIANTSAVHYSNP